MGKRTKNKNQLGLSLIVPKHFGGANLAAMKVQTDQLSHRGIRKGDFLVYRVEESRNSKAIEIYEIDGLISAEEIPNGSSRSKFEDATLLGAAIGYCKNQPSEDDLKLIEFDDR